VTSYTNEATLELAKKTTPYGYLLKPFEERELLTSIEIALYKFAMEKELKKRERWLFTILESIADAVIATDDKKDITFMNPMAENLTGWKQSTLLGRPLGSIFRAGDEKVRAEISRFFEKDFRRSNKNGFAGEVILNSKAGMKIPVEFRITPIQEKKKQISGIVLAFSDISRRKKARGKLEKKLGKAKKSHARNGPGPWGCHRKKGSLYGWSPAPGYETGFGHCRPIEFSGRKNGRAQDGRRTA